MNKQILIIGAIGLFALASVAFQTKSATITPTIAHEFEKFATQQNRLYSEEEALYRMQVFANNFNKVQKMNNSNDGVVYALNKFADMTTEEFKAIFLGYKKGSSNAETVTFNNTVNAAVDWTTKGDVQKVKDQGQCGSCWAFSAVGSMESEAAIHGSGLGNFSEQQLVDCSKKQGNQGCNGGLMDYAFDYVKIGGITTESAYPYKAVDQKCKTDGGDFKLATYHDVKSSDCTGLATALQQQPISIAVDAEEWQFYSSGVFSKCGKSLDHGVLLVGIDASGTWKVKNSWGTSWGEKGFIQLKDGNTCGLCLAASWPSISK